MSSAWDGLINSLEKTELPHYAINKSLPADSYFTSKKTAQKCIDIFFHYLEKENVKIKNYTIIEPSAGEGIFFDLLPKNKIGIDLFDRRDDILTKDYLVWKPKNIDTKHLVIGNPPFGVRGALALAFINRSFLFSDYVGFILPMSFHSNGKGTNMKRVQNGHLIYSEILEGGIFFSPDNNKEIRVNTLFQIWKKGTGEKFFPDYDVSEYVNIYTVCGSHDRLCGLERIGTYDFYVSSSFFGDTLSTVYNWDDVKYQSGYGIIIKKDKELIMSLIKNVEWNNYSSLSTNSCKHLRMYSIEKSLFDLGFGKKKHSANLNSFFP